MSCSVKNCKNAKRFKPEGIHFHRFPKGQLLDLWKNSLELGENWQWSANKYVCSKHFKDSDYLIIDNRAVLKQNAVPFIEGVPSIKESRKSEQFKVPVTNPSALASTSRANVGDSILDSSVSTAANSSVKETSQTSIMESSISQTSRESTTFSSSSRSSSHAHSKRKVGVIKKRIKLEKIHGIDTSTNTSTDSSTKRRRSARWTRFMHTYSTSPGKIKKKYMLLKASQSKARRQLYTAKRTIKTLHKKITNLKVVVEDLKQNQSLSEGAAFHLEKSYEDLPNILMRRYLKNITRETTSKAKYPEKLRIFAATLQFYSSKAYEYVRKTFALALPHQSVLRKWCSNVECEPGFCELAFGTLKLKVEEAATQNREIICSLMMDEIAIKKQVEFDGKKMWGYIDVGTGIASDDLQPATEALVFMVVCHNSHWKLPIAYFFIKGLTGRGRANITNEALIRLQEVGVSVTSITCDGPSVHFAMLKELGCKLDEVHNLQTWFPHPAIVDNKIYCLLDVCHMLKILRNMVASLKSFKNPRGEIISWEYIEKLYNVQDKETLRLGNKLRKSHLEWDKQKMKVALAAQTLSASVADAIEFLCVELKHPEFQGAEATVEFIRLVDTLFDILNSRSPWAKKYKAPLRASNENLWRPFLVNSTSYLLNCMDISGRPLWCTPKKTPILGFVISSLSVMGLFTDYVLTNRLNYLLTYKLSQDHLEIFFCSVRSRNGWNNNPTPRQFYYAFRRLLLFSKVCERGGNCKVLDSTTMLSVSSSSIKDKITTPLFMDVSVARRYQLVTEVSDHDYDVLPLQLPLSDVAINIVTYISGYVLKMLQKTVKCPECIVCCTASRQEISNLKPYKFLVKKDKGGLKIPSEGVVTICNTAEIFIKRMLIITDKRMPSEASFLNTFILAIAQQYYNKVDELFPSFEDHFFATAVEDENHGYALIKSIVAAYSRIRLFNLAKIYTNTIQGPAIRKELTKLILFNHQ